MTRRRATPAEHHTLTTAAIALALIAWHYTPGPTALPATVLTYLAAITGGAWTLRWDVPHALASALLHLRLTAATSLRAAAHITNALALLLALAAHHVAPSITTPAHHANSHL
jgi:hypothetical protein